MFAMRVRLRIGFALAALGFVAGCGGDGGATSRGVPAMCEAAPLLPEPSICAGPDDDGWSNLESPDPEPCPPPPGDCVQAVLGRLTDTARYIDCPGYVVLNRDDWSIDLNDRFIACIDGCAVGTCDPPILIASPESSIPDYSDDFMQTSVTSRELCQLHNAGCDVVVEPTGQGYASCPCP
jgi:hypothetical protein